MKVTWDIANIKSVYGKKKASQASSKPFTIPIQDNGTAKTNNTSKKKDSVTWGIADIQNVYGTEKSKK
jgi:hypothetical protein